MKLRSFASLVHYDTAIISTAAVVIREHREDQLGIRAGKVDRRIYHARHGCDRIL